MKKALALSAIAIFMWQAAFAQEAQPKSTDSKSLSYYKVEFVLRELQDNKVINTRHYSMLMSDRQWAETKVGSRVPVHANDKDFQYLDVGVNIRARATDHEGDIAVDSTIELSSFALPEQRAAAGSNENPVLSQLKVSLPAVVEPGKQTVIGMMDDVNSTRRYELAVTVTKLK